MASARYAREVARAKALGFASPYQRRLARTKALGYNSERQRRTESEFHRGKRRDTRAEYATSKAKANREGFRNPSDRATAKKLGLQGDALETWQRERVLAHFKISRAQFDRIRAANRKWDRENPSMQWTKINTYDRDVDANVHNWSQNRVGYILAFHAAIVNPKTNYDSLTKDGRRILKNGKRVTNKSQFFYLVKYTNLMQVDEFEARYGATVVKEASTEEVTP